MTYKLGDVGSYSCQLYFYNSKYRVSVGLGDGKKVVFIHVVPLDIQIVFNTDLVEGLPTNKNDEEINAYCHRILLEVLAVYGPLTVIQAIVDRKERFVADRTRTRFQEEIKSLLGISDD